ncbi:transmembrane protein 98 isoform X2 [Anabrus simplex]|uniref:transmembrane protein 98 isoform X2 n=1 Tax=Anabrus simplex TaxID=316456 RepID=UPI0035A35F47
MFNDSVSIRMNMETMETVVAVAIGVLAAVFVGALVVLVLICRRHKGNEEYLNKHITDARPDVHLIESDRPDLELGEVRLHPDIEQILDDEQWIGDATGLVPHGLAVLKTCHMLTERLAALAMGPLNNSKTGHEIIEVARRISPRVDDMVRSMYPPLDARLLEARTAALALAVTHLALVTRLGCSVSYGSRRLRWIDEALSDMDKHLLVLREAALAQEASCRIQNAIASTTTPF